MIDKVRQNFNDKEKQQLEDRAANEAVYAEKARKHVVDVMKRRLFLLRQKAEDLLKTGTYEGPLVPWGAKVTQELSSKAKPRKEAFEPLIEASFLKAEDPATKAQEAPEEAAQAPGDAAEEAGTSPEEAAEAAPKAQEAPEEAAQAPGDASRRRVGQVVWVKTRRLVFSWRFRKLGQLDLFDAIVSVFLIFFERGEGPGGLPKQNHKKHAKTICPSRRLEVSDDQALSAAASIVSDVEEKGQRLSKMQYRDLEEEYIAHVLLDDLLPQDRLAIEKVRETGYGYCSRCEFRYGCSACDPEKAFSFYTRRLLWEKVSRELKPAAKPRGRPKKFAAPP